MACRRTSERRPLDPWANFRAHWLRTSLDVLRLCRGKAFFKGFLQIVHLLRKPTRGYFSPLTLIKDDAVRLAGRSLQKAK